MNYHYPPEKNARLRELMKYTKASLVLQLDGLRKLQASEREATQREDVAYNNGAADAGAKVKHVVPAARALMEHIIRALNEIAPDDFVRKEVAKNIRKNFDGYFELIGACPSEAAPEDNPMAVKWRLMNCAPRDGSYFLALTQTNDPGSGRWSVSLDCIPKGKDEPRFNSWYSLRHQNVGPQWWAPFSPPDGSKLEPYGSWDWVDRTGG